MIREKAKTKKMANIKKPNKQKQKTKRKQNQPTKPQTDKNYNEWFAKTMSFFLVLWVMVYEDATNRPRAWQ